MLSDNIRNYRKINNMSQDELAEKLGVSRQSISLWETGQTQPTIDNIIALSKIFNVTSDEILKSDDSTLDIVKNPQDKVPAEKKKNKTWLLVTIIGITVIIGAVLFSVLLKTDFLKTTFPAAAQRTVRFPSQKAPIQARHQVIPAPRSQTTVQSPMPPAQAQKLPAAVKPQAVNRQPRHPQAHQSPKSSLIYSPTARISQ